MKSTEKKDSKQAKSKKVMKLNMTFEEAMQKIAVAKPIKKKK